MKCNLQGRVTVLYMRKAVFLLVLLWIVMVAGYIARGRAKDDLFQLAGLMAHNAFPEGLRSNVVDFYWPS